MTGTKKMTVAVLFGLGTILLLAVIASFFVALLARLTTMSDSHLSIIIFIFAIISMIIAGFITGVKAKEKGWLAGGFTGVAFTILIFLITYLGYGKPLSGGNLLYHVGLIAASTIGGILGVNVTKKD